MQSVEMRMNEPRKSAVGSTAWRYSVLAACRESWLYKGVPPPILALLPYYFLVEQLYLVLFLPPVAFLAILGFIIFI